MPGDDLCQGDEGLCNVVEVVFPVGGGMGPGELDQTLRFPLRRKVHIVHNLSICGKVTKSRVQNKRNLFLFYAEAE